MNYQIPHKFKNEIKTNYYSTNISISKSTRAFHNNSIITIDIET